MANIKKIYPLMILIILAIVISVYLSISRNKIAQSSQIFQGVINVTLPPQNLTGIKALSDEGCMINPNSGLSNCTTTLDTKYGIISFSYKHNETLQPCISNGDIINLQIKAGRAAIITRTYENVSNSNQSQSCKV